MNLIVKCYQWHDDLISIMK